MITGIQITKAANDDLLNSFWLLDSEKGEARCLCAKGGFAEDDVVAVSKLGEIEYREIGSPRGRRSAPERKRAASRNSAGCR